jgi:hypothetical protein
LRLLQLVASRAHQRSVQTSSLLRQQAAARSSSGFPEESPLAKLPQARGRFAQYALAAPRRNDRSPDGFTPTCLTWTLPVTRPCRTSPGKWCCSATVRIRSLANGLAELVGLLPNSPCRAVFLFPSRKVTKSTAPGVPSTVGLFGFPKSSHCSPARYPATLQQPSAFSTSSSSGLD